MLVVTNLVAEVRAKKEQLRPRGVDKATEVDAFCPQEHTIPAIF